MKNVKTGDDSEHCGRRSRHRRLGQRQIREEKRDSHGGFPLPDRSINAPSNPSGASRSGWPQ